jgi:uncharacterized SAM-dependent methyltransferase
MAGTPVSRVSVNNLIFKELLKRGYSLEGNTRVWNIADSKLWYLTSEQAKAYLKLEDAKSYSDKMFNTEIEMLKKFMPEISKKILLGSDINIIDVGCGDGKKAVPVINFLHGKVELRYCPIDISSYMVSHAIEKIKQLEKGEVVEFRWNISDFDNLENISALLRDKKFRQNFFLFLGSTISNFEMHEVMYEVVEAMDSTEDYLLLGLALGNNIKPSELIEAYKTDIQDDFLSLILTQIGFSREDVELGMRYRNSRIEAYYIVKNDVVLRLGGKYLRFYKGDQILVATSKRYTKETLEKELKIYFKDYKFFLNEDESWALILCKK